MAGCQNVTAQVQASRLLNLPRLYDISQAREGTISKIKGVRAMTNEQLIAYFEYLIARRKLDETRPMTTEPVFWAEWVNDRLN